MTWICVNRYELMGATSASSSGSGSGLSADSTPRCVANWAHTQEQILIAVCLWGALLLFSVGWTIASRRETRRLRMDEIGFSLRYRRWARTSRTAAIINRPVQLVTSTCIFAFMIARCSSYEVSIASYVCMTVLYVIALVDTGVRFLATRYKMLFCFSPMALLEVLMIASHCQIGLGSTKIIDGEPTRTWLDFSIMRAIFILRSYLEMEKHLLRASRVWMMLRLAVKLLLLIAFGASIMFFLETLGEMPFFQQNGFAHLYACEDGGVTRDGNICEEETWSIMFSFYFTVVTLGTVGYGDNSPQTVMSRLLAIMFIVLGIILFSMEIDNLIALYTSRLTGNPPYSPKSEARHVVIMGNPTFAQLSSILRELFHEDHASSNDNGTALHAVILGERKSAFTRELVAKLEADPIFAVRVTYVAGNPTRVEDLERALVRDAEAVFVFPNKLSDDPVNEDALNIMRVLATRRHCGSDVRCLVMVLRAESSRHMLAAGVQREDVICESVIKMGTLAQSAVSHGASTMLANLAASLSVGVAPEANGADKKSAARRAALKDSTGHSDLLVSAADLDDSSRLSRRRSWLKEYYTGAAKEMYLIQLSKKYAGMTFAEASSRIFNQTSGNIVLIAVEVIFSGLEDSGGNLSTPRVLLNPGSSLIMAEWMQCYVIADDLQHVFTHGICPDEVSPEDEMPHSITPTIIHAPTNTYVEPVTKPLSEHDTVHEDEIHNGSVYSRMSTPRGSIHQQQSMGVNGMESVVMDRSLRTVALSARDIEDSAVPSFITARSSFSRPASHSISSEGPRTLEPPPLSVLTNPKHIVVCSFLGEDAHASLQWLLLPLRSAYARSHPPITILDVAEPSLALTTALTAFNDVYYVRGSPLVYLDLQRAGAKAAGAVIVLGNRAKTSLVQFNNAEADIESSIVDSEAIFSTMLIELKMDFTKIFTITELADESNSKFLGTSFQLRNASFLAMGNADDIVDMDMDNVDTDVGESGLLEWWEYLLMNDMPKQKSEKEIFGLPLYMSGRLLHPELCENMLVQTFYNPSIPKIVQQLVGGPRCTGVILTYNIPNEYREGYTYGDLFHAFSTSAYAGICIGLYRISSQRMPSGQEVELRVVLTTPDPTLRIVGDDQVFVLVGAHTLASAATSLQRFYRRWCSPDHGAADESEESSTRNSGASSKPSFLDPRSRISRYLAPKNKNGLDIVNVPTSQRRSYIAQENSSWFRSQYV